MARRRSYSHGLTDYELDTRRQYAGDDYDRYGYDAHRSRPIVRRVGAGRKGRTAVETGGSYNALRDDIGERSGLPLEPRVNRRRDDAGSYDFTLPARPPATKAATFDLVVEDVSFPLADDANANEESQRASQAGRPKFSGAVAKVEVSQSRWLGSAYDRGDLSAEITVHCAANGGKHSDSEQRAPLTKWHHLERSAMSFEEFISAAHSVLEISVQKRRNVNRLLRDVQSKFEKQRQHGRDLVPDCVSDLYAGDGSKDSASIMFLAFPYFCLEPYSTAQLKNLTTGTPMHPLRPLLQAHFHSTAQKREMAQAITKLPSTESGKCLHVSQVWCLIVDNATIVTCSRQSLDKLHEPAITKSNAAAPDEKTKVRVSFGNDRSWQIPIDADTTWPSFVSIFGEDITDLGDNEDDVAVAKFKVNGNTVAADQWPFLVQAAQHSFLELDLQQQTREPGSGAQVLNDLSATINASLDVNPTATAGPDSQAQTEPHQPDTGLEDVNMDGSVAIDIAGGLAIFRNGSSTPLDSLADDLHNVLRSVNREEERKAYDRVVATKPLSMTTQWIRTSNKPSADNRGKVVGAALYLFLFFWDLTFDHPLVEKYWGAVEGIMRQDSRTYAAAYIDATLSRLMETVVPMVESLVQDFSASPQDLSPLPDAFSKAFLHLTMIFTILSQTSERRKFGHRGSTVQEHIKGLKRSLIAGKREITTRLKTQSGQPELEDVEICSHTSLFALVLNQFSQDVMHGQPDVASSYNDYFYRLEFQITQDPAPRSHQESLRFFLQEVEAIFGVLQYQSDVIDAFDESLSQQRTAAGDSQGDDSALRWALGISRQQIVLNECKARIASRIDKFKGLQQRAQELGEWHRDEIEMNKDRQENAIMVFTIVTITFLPLSFVSSVFGMNTTDVRDMPYGQWAFWAAAAPLTIVVVAGSLWWAGEFEGFGKWVQQALSRASSAGGYQRIPEPVSYTGRAGHGEEVQMRHAAPATYLDAMPPAPRRRPTYPRTRHGRGRPEMISIYRH